MIFTEDDDLALKLRMIRNQGEDPENKYIHMVLGTNARMMDMQAAIGLRQMDKFEAILKKRRKIALFYYSKFSSSRAIILSKEREGSKSSWFFAPILVENRDRVAKELNSLNIATRIAYPIPVYEQPFFSKYRRKDKRYNCPNAKWMTKRVLNLPMFHSMTEEAMKYVADSVIKVVKKHAR